MMRPATRSPARAWLAPVRGGVAHPGEGSLEVHPDHRVPVVLGHAVQDRVPDDAGVVHEDIEAAVMVDRLADQLLRGVEVGDVVVVGDGVSSGVSDESHGEVGVAPATLRRGRLHRDR